MRGMGAFFGLVAELGRSSAAPLHGSLAFVIVCAR
jgi:hypothetical protein